MLSKKKMNLSALLLTIILLATVAPFCALAEESNVSAIDAVQERIDYILETYLLTDNYSADGIESYVASMEGEFFYNAVVAVKELDNSEQVKILSEAQADTLAQRNEVYLAFYIALDARHNHDYGVGTIASGTVSDGEITWSSGSRGEASYSDGKITATASSGKYITGSVTVTITNASSEKATISFDYTVTGAKSLTVDGVTATGGKVSKELEGNASIEIKMEAANASTAFGSNTGTLILSNFNYVAAQATSTVTIQYNSTLGSVAVGGSPVNNDSTQSVTLGDSLTLVAEANNNGKFWGWVDETGFILETSDTYTITPQYSQTIKALFFDINADIFMVGAAQPTNFTTGLLNGTKHEYSTVPNASYYYDNLLDAITAASNTTSKVIVPLTDATIPAGDYTIPAGVILLIPFDDSNTMYTGAGAECVDSRTTVNAYRTLTLEDGASIVVNGSISVSGKHQRVAGGTPYGAAPSGNTGFIDMGEGSSITINNGGTLYAYGFVTGSGSVTVKSGGSVYELFQITDFRGGTQSTDMTNNVFPISQYYVQNVEVSMTFESGAHEYCYTTVFVSNTYIGSKVEFIGKNSGMFQITSGTFTKKYDGTTDRLILTANGNSVLSSVELNLSLASVNSADYVMGLNNNITIHVASGSVTVNQSVALLPGVAVMIDSGATLTLGKDFNAYVYDSENWGNFCSSTAKKWIPVCYAPGRTYDRQESDLTDVVVCVNGTLDASAGNLYTTCTLTDSTYSGGGASIISDGGGTVITKALANSTTYQYEQGSVNAYTSIGAVSAQLKNGDGTYVKTAEHTDITSYTYCGDCLAWLCDEGTTHSDSISHATNVELGNSLNMYFAFWSTSNTGTVDNFSNYFAELTCGDVTQKLVMANLTPRVITLDDRKTQVTAYVIYFDGIAAAQMNELVTVRLYTKNADGTENTICIWKDSIRAYATRLLAEHSDNKTLCTLLVDMLNYGAACQTLKNSGVDANTLANNSLTAAQKALASPDKTLSANCTPNTGGYYKDSQLYADAEGNFAIRLDGTDWVSIKFVFDNHWGNEVSVPVPGNGTDKCYVSKLVIADARAVITITITRGDGTTETIQDSVLSYCARMGGQGVYAAFMKFADSAKIYLESGEDVRLP